MFCKIFKRDERDFEVPISCPVGNLSPYSLVRSTWLALPYECPLNDNAGPYGYEIEP
jgi:hypothetical protein